MNFFQCLINLMQETRRPKTNRKESGEWLETPKYTPNHLSSWHSSGEPRKAPAPRRRTILCRFYEQGEQKLSHLENSSHFLLGSCKHGGMCTYAHGEENLGTELDTPVNN